MDSVQTDATTAMPWAKLVAALPSGRGRKSALEKALAPTGFTPQTFRAEAVQLEASVRESPWADVADVMDKHAVPLQDRAKNGDRGNTTTGHLCRRSTRKHIGVARPCGYSGQVALR